MNDILEKFNLIKSLINRQEQLLDDEDDCIKELRAINIIIKGLTNEVSSITHDVKAKPVEPNVN